MGSTQRFKARRARKLEKEMKPKAKADQKKGVKPRHESRHHLGAVRA
jgi:hypothetical protein